MRCSLCDKVVAPPHSAEGWVQVAVEAGPARRYFVICPDERMTMVSDELGAVIAGLREVKVAPVVALPTPRSPRPTPKKGRRK